MRLCAVVPFVLIGFLIPRPAGAACTGDCNADGRITINELIQGVNIALDLSPVAVCPAMDPDGKGDVSIGELIAAVGALMNGCPGAPTPTATNNQPPVLPTASSYRTFPSFPIAVAIAASDPEGRPVACTVADLPAGATFDEATAVLSWTPGEDQLGAFYVPFSCSDDAAPPASGAGTLTFRVSARDACAIPSCGPASGCTVTLPPVDQPCCTGGPVARVPEPVAGCPEGRVLYVGQNQSLDSFGRLQNCDVMEVIQFQQQGAEVQFHVETRCLSTLNRLTLVARMESNAPDHPQMFHASTLPRGYAESDDGFARAPTYRFAVEGPGPFFDVQDAEANLFLTLKDSNDVEVTHAVRVRLSFTPRPTDLPDVDPTLPPMATRTATPMSAP